MDKDDIIAVADRLKPEIDAAVARQVKAFAEPLQKSVDTLSTNMRERPTVNPRTEVSVDGGKTWSPGRNWRKRSAITIPNFEMRRFSMARMMLAMQARSFDSASVYEKEVWDEVAKQKAQMQLGNAELGGFMIPDEWLAGIEPNLRAEPIFETLGAEVITGLTSRSVNLRRRKSSTGFYWVGESQAPTKSGTKYEIITLTPKKGGCLTDVTNDLLLKDPSVVEAEIQRDFSQTLALGEDLAFFEGSGVGGQPLGAGILTVGGVATGVQQVDFTSLIGDYQYFQGLENMKEKLELANINNFARAAFIMPYQAWHKLSQIQIPQAAAGAVGAPGAGFPILSQGNYQSGIPRTLYGFPVLLTNNLTVGSTTCSIYFGAWSYQMVARWGGPRLAMSSEAGNRFDQDETGFRLIDEIDFNSRHPQAIVVGTTFTH